jgi:hypothetical protein
MSQGDHVVKISAEAPPHQKASRLATGDNLVMLRHPIHQSIAIAGGIVLWEISSAWICRLELFSLSLSLSLRFAHRTMQELFLGDCTISYG